VNLVWSYINELLFKVFQRERRFLSGYDLQKYTNGASKEGLRLHSQTIQGMTAEYATWRKQFKKAKLAGARAAARGARLVESRPRHLASLTLTARSGMAKSGCHFGTATA